MIRQEEVFKYGVFNTDWYQVMDDGSKVPIDVPGKCSAKKNELVTITSKVPNKLELGEITTWLCFRTTKQDMAVYIDGKLRKEYNTKDTRLWGKTSVSTYFFVPLYSSDCGKDITVTFVSNSNYAGVIRNIYYGTASGLILQFVNENMFEVLSAILIFILPPSIEELKETILNSSKVETPEMLIRKFNSAYPEINSISKYNYGVVNDNVDAAVEKIEKIISAEECRVDRIKDELSYIIG